MMRRIGIVAIALLVASCGSAPPASPRTVPVDPEPPPEDFEAIGVDEVLARCDGGDQRFCRLAGQLRLGAQLSWHDFAVSPDPDAARASFAAACGAGDLDACADELWAKALQAPIDAAMVARATELCTKGSALGCTLAGIGAGKELANKALLGKACDGGEQVACGILVREGDSARAAEGCERGTASMCYAAALQAKDEATAIGFLVRSCQLGTFAGCMQLAVMNQLGQHGPIDPTFLRSTYERGCKQGVDQACQSLAYLYQIGLGVERDPAKAFAIDLASCRAGEDVAPCARIAIAQLLGEGVPADPKAALATLEPLCAQSSMSACVGTALAELKGLGGKKKNVAHARAALAPYCPAERGSGIPRACTTLGQLAEMDRDLAGALELYARGCSRLWTDACWGEARLTRDAARKKALMDDLCARKFAPACAARDQSD